MIEARILVLESEVALLREKMAYLTELEFTLKKIIIDMGVKSMAINNRFNDTAKEGKCE